MIPNAGLDNIAAYRPWGSLPGTGLSGSGNDSSGSQWLAYAAISEDSSTPTASDTGIGSEAMRTNSTGGFSRTATAIRDTDANRLGVSIERAYVFEIDANLNITKYGYVPLSAGGNFSWIDLTRADPDDPGSTPVTLTLVPGDQLQLWQTLTVTVPWSVDLEQFVITGTDGNDSAGTHDAYCGFYASGSGLQDIADIISQTFWPDTLSSRVRTYTAAASAARDTAPASSVGGEFLLINGELDDYVAGNYYRDKLYTLSTSQGNGSLTAIQLMKSSVSADTGYGFKIVFDNPATFEKDNLHTLTLTFRVSWAEG